MTMILASLALASHLQQGALHPWSPLPISVSVTGSGPASHTSEFTQTVSMSDSDTFVDDAGNTFVLGTSKLLTAVPNGDIGSRRSKDPNDVGFEEFFQNGSPTTPTNGDSQKQQAFRYTCDGTGPASGYYPVHRYCEYKVDDPAAASNSNGHSIKDVPGGSANYDQVITY